MPINYNLFLEIPPQRVSPLRSEERDYTVVLPYYAFFDDRRVITPKYYRSRTKYTFETTILLDNEQKKARVLKAPRVILTETIYKKKTSYKHFIYNEYFEETDVLRSYDHIIKQVSKEFNMNIQPTTKYSLLIVDPYCLQWIPDFKFAPRKILKPIVSQGNLFVFRIDTIDVEESINEKNIKDFIATSKIQLGSHELHGQFITSSVFGINIAEMPPYYQVHHVSLPFYTFITLSSKITIIHPEHELVQFSVQPNSRLFIVHFRVDTIE